MKAKFSSLTQYLTPLRLKSNGGFTLVELLIVIVIIAILAAITVVAYNGIQSRARETSALSDLSNIAKQIERYNIENGGYPDTWQKMKTIGAKTSISYGNSRVLLCSNSSTGFAVFIYDVNIGRQYVVQSGQSPKQVIPALSWSSVPLCASTPYPAIAWGDTWLTNAS